MVSWMLTHIPLEQADRPRCGCNIAPQFHVRNQIGIAMRNPSAAAKPPSYLGDLSSIARELPQHRRSPVWRRDYICDSGRRERLPFLQGTAFIGLEMTEAIYRMAASNSNVAAASYTTGNSPFMPV